MAADLLKAGSSQYPFIQEGRLGPARYVFIELIQSDLATTTVQSMWYTFANALEQLTPLRIIFTKFLEEEKIPDIWKVGHISAINKSGSRSKAENYRPISLTSVPGKIMERLIRDRIVDHMTENNFFSPEQHGFISGKSYTTQLLEFLEDLTEALDSGKDVDVIYLDFQKALNKVPHKRLLKKLWAYGIGGKIHSWIKEFLSNRIQTVLVDGNSSSKAKVTSGIPQGSVLGPILFLIFINNLPSVIQALKKLFADDAKVYQIVTCMADVTHLQSVVNNSIDWSILWKMFFNFKKCKHMHLGNHDMNQAYTMKKDQEEIPIEKVVSEKDLGVIVDNTLTFSKHISSKIKTANRNLGIIFRTFTYLDKDIFMNLFKSLVRTHLEYASPVGSPVFKKDRIAIENVQRRATKLVRCILHLPYSERLRALGLPSLEYRRERADVIQVYKILHNIDKVDKNKLFTLSGYTATRGHSLKLFKRRSRLKIRANSFSNRVVDVWNSLPEQVVQAPSLYCFKSRLNNWWKHHPAKFNPSCYIPGQATRIYTNYQNASGRGRDA